MDENLKSYLDARFAQIDSELSEIRATVEKTETTLLSEFYKWARQSDIRTRQHGNTLSGHDERVQLLEDRVAELERRRLP